MYVFASKSDRDARKVLGKSLPQHGVHMCVAGRSELFDLEKLLNGHQAWLAAKIPEWDKRYVEGRKLPKRPTRNRSRIEPSIILSGGRRSVDQDP